MNDDEVEKQLAQYEELTGAVPAGIRARLTLLSAIAPEYLQQLEEMRAANVRGEHLDPNIVQFVMFAILLFDRDEDATVHARIALRQGATVQQLLDVVKIAGWLGGAQAYNLGFRALLDAASAEEIDWSNPPPGEFRERS